MKPKYARGTVRANSSHNYLHQGGYIYAGTDLFVCYKHYSKMLLADFEERSEMTQVSVVHLAFSSSFSTDLNY